MDEIKISQFKSKRGLKRIAAAFCYSMSGLKSACQFEAAFRQELAFVIPGIIIAIFLPITRLESLLLIGVLVLVLIVELINSAIETIVDRISLECNPLSARAKDYGSAMVFLTIGLAVLTWLIVLWRLLWASIPS